jgi:predicted glycosyltransferase
MRERTAPQAASPALKSLYWPRPATFHEEFVRVAIYTQHFLGVGHHVRSNRLARALARSHSVRVFDGGRPFAGAGESGDGLRVQLPAVVKGDRGLESFECGVPLAETMRARQRLLEAAVREMRPDLLIVESFPLSRWVFREEIFGAMRVAREANPKTRVAASIRDVPRASQSSARGPVREWDAALGRPVPLTVPDDHLDRASELLGEHFDALLVHGDPRLTRLEDHFPWVPSLRIPLLYTGYVRQEPAAPLEPASPRPGRPLITVSVGGGVNGRRLLETAAQAWARLATDPAFAGGTMMLFAGAFMDEGELAPIAQACRRTGAILRPFSNDFEAWLGQADLSISRAGYNTTVALLAAGVRSIVVPATDVSDQAFRAQRMHALGLADTCADAELDAGRLARMIADALARPRPRHDIDLDGAHRTVILAEALVAGDLTRDHARMR